MDTKCYMLNENDVRIIKKALRQRIEDLTGFADELEKKGQKRAANQFLEMTNDVDQVLEKMEVHDD